AKQSKIYIAIDDPYNSGNYVSAVDSTQSTITVTGEKKSYTFGPGGYAIQVMPFGDDAGAGIYSKYDLVYVQLPVALAKDGSDDGTYTVEITPVDNAGNVGNKITRTFIYDTVVPTITPVNVPSTGDTVTEMCTSVNVADANGVSDEIDAVKLYLLDSSGSLLSTYNMSKSTTTTNLYELSLIPTDAGTIYYYFTARDYAGNVSTYPAGAHTNYLQGLKLVVSDKTGPWAVIGNQATKGAEPTSYIKTMVGIPVDGAFVQNYTDSTNPKVDDIPPGYSASNNILQATLEDEAVSATFYYRLSGSLTWNALTTSETSSQVWEATWDTTGLQTGIYDIKIVAMDAYGNVSDPSSVGSSAWVQVELKDALPPEATIDTTENDVKISDGGDVDGTLVLCAKPSTTGNLDFDSIRFEYQKAGTNSWVSISTDTDKTSSSLTTVKFYLDYADIPKINQTNSVSIDTSQITGVSLDFTSDIYDTVMTKTGNRWGAEVSFPPGTYDYKIKIEYADGTSVSVRDPNEQDNDGVITNSRINIAEFTAVWDVSSLSEGSYYVRAVARDSRGVEDTDAQYITVIVDRTPASISITQPNSSDNRLKTGTATTLYAEVNGDDASRVFFLYSDDGGATWQRIAAEDTDDSDGWSQSWTPNASLSSDATYLLRACVLDRAGNLGTSSDLSVVLDATDPVIDEFSINGSSGTVDLNAGTQYSWKLTSSDSDIDYLELSYSGSDSNITWSPGKTIYSQTGSFSGTLLITETDNVQRTITAKLYDKSGRTDTEFITVNVKDVTPSYPTITEVDGLRVRSGEKITTSNDRITVRCELDVLDGGVLKYQYKPSASSTWSTWQTNAAASPDTVLFPPQGVVLSDGDYDLRVLAIDNDNNSAISSVVTITVDSSQPVIKPASIISVDTNGNITAVEYDEEVDQVKFEYRKQGTSEWTYLNTDAAADATYGNAGKEWSVSLAGLPAETYEIRAISQISGVTEADVSITPVATVEIKEDSAGNKTYLLNPQTQISASITNPSFSSTYAGSENTFSATLQITSSQTLTDISARLLMDRATGSDVDKFLNVSGSTTIFTSSVDLSDLAQAGGSGVIVINAIDSSGNILSISKEFCIVAAAYQPDTNQGAGRVTDVDFTGNLENKSALAILPATMPQTPSSQASLISPVGEPWEFILSEPEAFKVTNTCSIEMTYTDNELNGIDENKLGIAYWDESNGRWSSEGITNVTRDLVNNVITFDTDHFSRFVIAQINAQPSITFISPVDYGAKDPIIEADIVDGFSAIREVKVEVDGVDQTGNLTNFAGLDGIDNNGNGLIDEESQAGWTTEVPLNQVSATSAKYKVKAPLHLSNGLHTIKITATNEQGVSTTQSTTFTVGSGFKIISAYISENPYNPKKDGDAKIIVNMTSNAYVKIQVLDFAGRELYSYKTPVETNGQDILWNGRDSSNRLLANGVYFIKIEANSSEGKDTKVIKAAILK
ncbi:MAG: Ig-like domain repeat protein, partial [Elusimicrobia bacterium]|nr:Ig-like domain repeat protein [Elusimicrobiota bacterium]